MPNRIIKESIKKSPQIDELSWFEEVVFYRLMVTADDYGCCDGRIIVLKNELFPTKDNVTKNAVEQAISKLASVGLLCEYTVNGMPYLFFPTWEKHQRVRNKHRKFPQPQVSNLSADCCQMTADRHPESESESNPNTNPKESTRTRFTPPTIHEVAEYCQERQNSVDPQQFVDFYASKGWRVGNQPMRDWRAAVRTWERRDAGTKRQDHKHGADRLLDMIERGDFDEP